MNQRVPPNPAKADVQLSTLRGARDKSPTWLRIVRFSYRTMRRMLRRQGIAVERGRAPEIIDRTERRERAATILLTIASAGTMMLTYFGVSIPMSEVGGGLLQKGQALAFAVTIGVFSWLGWYFLFGLIPVLRGKRLAAAIAGGALYIGVIAGIDAPFNMLALAGGSAVQMSMVDTASSYEGKPGPLVERITATRRLVPALRTQAARFGALEKLEERTGAHSGKPNAGKVSAGFGQIANLLGTLADALEVNLGQAEAIQRDLAAAIAAMKAQAYKQTSLRDRMEAVSTAADRADVLLAKMSQFDATLSIKATLRSLETIFVAPTLAASQFERTQNAELAAIAQMAKPVAVALQEALGALPPLPTDAGERVRPLDPTTAIKTYWKPLLPQWLAALFVDLAPGLLLVLLIAGRREAEHAANTSAHEGGKP